MYKVFETIESLYKEIIEDKNWSGAESALRNRYPLRFVLFENFFDFQAFINECTNHNIFVESMEKWMIAGSDDLFPTYSQLATRFEEYVKSVPANDYVIAPFSEIARFYDNKNYSEFDSLLKTIRLIQSPEEAANTHQRIYVPIIGMQSKMNSFNNDPSIFIWEYRSGQEWINYKLILTKGTMYGVQGLSEQFTICNNLREWIVLWKAGDQVNQTIICSSKAIFNNAHNAQPDNAFEFTICNNAYEFLKDGLQFDFKEVEFKEEESHYWEKLACQVDIRHFNLNDYVNERFNSFSLESIPDFVQAWFEYNDDFSRWLLKTYYLIYHQSDNYLIRILKMCFSQSTSELFSALASNIFEEPYDEKSLRQRQEAINSALRYGIKITELAEKKIEAKLSAIAADPERSYRIAMRYMTSLTKGELNLMVKWLGENHIERNDISSLYPQLFNYLTPLNLQLDERCSWVNNYFQEYVRAKLSNRLTQNLNTQLNEKNNSPVEFELWRAEFKTVKTILQGREDIDVYYWIDGLGVEWIPYIMDIVERHKTDGIYLNEIHIATAELPTKTENNKCKLEELSNGNLKKIGDLDSFSHSPKKYPQCIVDELNIVEEAIANVLKQYAGQKVAFISDHGITAMACKAKGLNIAGIKADHAGRCGIWESGNSHQDKKYIILEDGKTVCALTYASLTSKTPDGQGAHGGATPEEVLVPIIIVSGQKNASSISAKIQNNEISATSPYLKYTIKGISNIDFPVVLYNSVKYSLHKVSGNTYVTEKIHIVDTATKATIMIGDFKHTDTLSIKTGVEEDDLFGDL